MMDKLNKEMGNDISTSTWNDSYKILIPKIDEQHKRFFDIYDDLVANCSGTEVSEKTQEIIDRLTGYLSHHFNDEELLMKEAGFDGLEQHINQHRFFENKVSELQLAQAYKNPLLLSKLLLFIRKWFLSHISKTDTTYQEAVLKYNKSL